MAILNLQARRSILACAVLASACSTASAQTGWTTSGFPGEEAKSVIGCSVIDTDEAWLCLAVRCEAEGRLGLYLEITGLGPEGPLDLVIDKNRYTVRTPAASSEIAYSHTIDGPVNEIISDLKAGANATVVHPTVSSRANQNRIPLRGSKTAIEGLERGCVSSADTEGSGVSSSLDVEYHNGKIVGYRGFSKRSDCAFATVNRVTVDGIEMDGGAIGGVWFVENGDRFHANLDREHSKDAAAKQQLTDFLSQKSATFDIGLHGCGAAGRISHLVYVKLSS